MKIKQEIEDCPSDFEQYKQSNSIKIQQFYQKYSQNYDYWIRKNRYYYEQQAKILRAFIPNPKRMLELGCGQGYFLYSLNPEHGVGVDFSHPQIETAKQQYPQYEFHCMDFSSIGDLDQEFDVIIAVNFFSEQTHIVESLKKLHSVMHSGTRLVILEYSAMWEPMLKLAHLFKLRPKRPFYNWLAHSDFTNIFQLSDYDLISYGNRILLPIKIPLLSPFLNTFVGRLPLFKVFGVSKFYIVRPNLPKKTKEELTATVLIPCKNEEDNVEEILRRTPVLGAGTEIILVDDKSTDRTKEIALAQIEKYPEKNISVVQGPGNGKGAACRAGFKEAKNDILMILDADMAVMPEDLPQFYDAIASGRGEFINGNRLMYQLEDDAMRTANIFGNKAFAFLFSLILRQPIKDTLCGTKAIFRKDYWKILETREYFNKSDIWGDYDWIYGAARYNLKILEIPIHYRERTAGETKMLNRLSNAMVMLKMCYLAFWKIYLR